MQKHGVEDRLIDDFQVVKEFIDNDYAPPKVSKKRENGYKAVDDISSLIKGWEKREETVGFDTETQGLDWLDPNFLVLTYQVSPAKGEAYEVTLYEEVPNDRPSNFAITWPRKHGKKIEDTAVYIRRTKGFEKKLQSLADLLASDKIKKYMSHGNFDLHAVEALFRREHMGPPVVRQYRMDIQAVANLVDENMFKMSSLSELQMAFTDVREDYKQEFDKTYNKQDMIAVPADKRLPYSCGDADVTRRAGIQIKSDLSNGGKKIARYLARFTMPALDFLKDLETNGALIDKDKLPKVTKEVHHEMIEAEDQGTGLSFQKRSSNISV